MGLQSIIDTVESKLCDDKYKVKFKIDELSRLIVTFGNRRRIVERKGDKYTMIRGKHRGNGHYEFRRDVYQGNERSVSAYLYSNIMSEFV